MPLMPLDAESGMNGKWLEVPEYATFATSFYVRSGKWHGIEWH